MDRQKNKGEKGGNEMGDRDPHMFMLTCVGILGKSRECVRERGGSGVGWEKWG